MTRKMLSQLGKSLPFSELECPIGNATDIASRVASDKIPESILMRADEVIH